MKTLIKGKVWKFGDNVSTDEMSPSFAMDLSWEERKKYILHPHPCFSHEVKPGDIIVAGRNWGCGSSREQAPTNLKDLGLGCVIAETYGRIYFRNSIAIAFPSVICPGISNIVEEGDELELELETAQIRNLTRGTQIQGEPFSEEILYIIKKGGLIETLTS